MRRPAFVVCTVNGGWSAPFAREERASERERTRGGGTSPLVLRTVEVKSTQSVISGRRTTPCLEPRSKGGRRSEMRVRSRTRAGRAGGRCKPAARDRPEPPVVPRATARRFFAKLWAQLAASRGRRRQEGASCSDRLFRLGSGVRRREGTIRANNAAGPVRELSVAEGGRERECTAWDRWRGGVRAPRRTLARARSVRSSLGRRMRCSTRCDAAERQQTGGEEEAKKQQHSSIRREARSVVRSPILAAAAFRAPWVEKKPRPRF